MSLPNPLGLAAGFDKNAEAYQAMLRAGFGFVECGTVTPKAQAGNPRPRLFRLAQDEAVINRLGFNNAGLEAFAGRLAGPARGGVVGANIGPNRDSADRIADYLIALDRLWGLCDYFAINISSPNTEGLRDLQSGGALEALLGALSQARAAKGHGGPPFFVKIAPDLAENDVVEIVEAAVRFDIDGLIVSNTTLARPATLRSRQRNQAGGLSGAPLMASSTRLLRAAREGAAGRLALIGAGGVGGGADAYAKIRAGANAVQLYSALVYKGPGLIGAILDDLAARLRADGFSSVGQAVGTA
jgi:dihydroorotate dehydrogenase